VNAMPDLCFDDRTAANRLSGIRLGFDVVQISRIAESIRDFGERFKSRLFTEEELRYAQRSENLCAERLAARFAAKEAVIKALRLSEAGIGWRDLEVRKLPDGSCDMVLHGRAAELARDVGATRLLVSLSHDGDYAGAVVMAQCPQEISRQPLLSVFSGEKSGTVRIPDTRDSSPPRPLEPGH